MRILFSTKNDKCGNIYKLVIDTDRRQYATETTGFFHRSDAVTVTQTDMRRLQAQAIADGYTRTQAL